MFHTPFAHLIPPEYYTRNFTRWFGIEFPLSKSRIVLYRDHRYCLYSYPVSLLFHTTLMKILQSGVIYIHGKPILITWEMISAER